MKRKVRHVIYGYHDVHEICPNFEEVSQWSNLLMAQVSVASQQSQQTLVHCTLYSKVKTFIEEISSPRTSKPKK